MIDYLRARSALPEMVPKAEANWLYCEASNFAFRTFSSGSAELITLGWEPAHIVAHVLIHAGLEEMDQEFLEAVEEELAEITDQEGEDEDDEDEEEETEDEPVFNDISPAIAKVQQEYMAGKMSPEKEAILKSIFGPDFFTAAVLARAGETVQ